VINLKRLISIQRISIFFLFSFSIFSAPLKIGVASDFNEKLVRFIMKQDETLDIEIVKYKNKDNLNRDLLDKKIDINIFQTLDYLNEYNNLNNSSIISIGKTYLESIGIYSKKHNSIKNIVKGNIIAIPNDLSNEKRSLIFLEKVGLIKLDHKKEITIDNIVSRLFNIKIIGIEPRMLPRVLKMADYVILNNTLAFDLGCIPRIDSLFLEDANKKYINIIATRKKLLKKKKIIRFSELIKSEETKIFILEKYGNNIILF